MKLAGNDMLIQSLINEGVEYIFGYQVQELQTPSQVSQPLTWIQFL